MERTHTYTYAVDMMTTSMITYTLLKRHFILPEKCCIKKLFSHSCMPSVFHNITKKLIKLFYRVNLK